MSRSSVDLGFSTKCEPWQVESYMFPSKIGGKPAWLDLEHLPSPENLQCEGCHQPMIFLCQIYAPLEENEDNFHRTIFVFICRKSECCRPNSSLNVKAFRSCLPRRNKFYSYDPPSEQHRDPDFSLSKWAQLCVVCGCLGNKKCAKCKKVHYCSKDHQVIDWKEGHKRECGSTTFLSRQSTRIFPESEIVIEAEEVKQNYFDEMEELAKFSQLECEGKTGTMKDTADKDIEKYVVYDDKVFSRFKERITDNPDQILRYERNGSPFWIASAPKPDIVPNCDYCGGPRQYEFQLMPQMLAILHEYELDIGVITVYTCGKSCIPGDAYKKEFIFKQDVTNTL